MSISDHEFGSQSTDLKLSIVEGYLCAYTKALRRIFPKLVYIDAFAGTGERTEIVEGSGPDLIDPETPERVERRRGSAKIAIEVQPKFDRLIFIEKNTRHFQALQELKASFPGRNIEIRNGRAEDEIGEVLRANFGAQTRGVLFLDPYGMDVPWTTLESIRATRAIDVWYLVSLAGLFRQATTEFHKLTPDKKSAITRMVGTDRWEKDWYSRSTTADLFGDADETNRRSSNVLEIAAWFKQRLSELFPKVLGPLILRNQQNVPMFALFFLISNPDPKAIGLATKIADHMLKLGKSSQTRPRK